jgi:hypothetical protein
MSTDEPRDDASSAADDEWDATEPLSDEARGNLRKAVSDFYGSFKVPRRSIDIPGVHTGWTPDRPPPAELVPDTTQVDLMRQAADHLADLAEQARADAKRARGEAVQSRQSTRHALAAAWAAVAVTIVVGIVQIVVALNG